MGNPQVESAVRAQPSSTNTAGAVMVLVGGSADYAARVAQRLDSLAPAGWDCLHVDRIEEARSDASPDPSLIAVLYEDGHASTVTGRAPRMLGLRGVSLAAIGDAAALPDGDACIRAGIHHRIDLSTDDDIVDTRLQHLVDDAARRRELHALESNSLNGSARLDAMRVSGASEAFARLLGAGSMGAIEGQALSAWLDRADTARLEAARETLANAPPGTQRAVLLRRASADGTQPLSAHLRVGGDQRLWLSLAALDVASLPILTRAPVSDARMALHRHLSSISRWTDQGRLSGLIFVGVDDIVPMQGRLGLARTDRLLESIGLFLIDRLADTDRCFRFGAGEFVLCVERGANSDISEFAQQLVSAIAETEFDEGERRVHCTASVSAIVLASDPASNDRRLFQVADTVQRIRESGGNRYAECEGDPLTTDAVSHDIWRARLEQALSEDRFRLAFQSITSLAGDHRRYYDVLLRYIDEQDRLVMPGDFMPSAEHCGLMPEIDRWVARAGARVIAEQAARDTEVALFIKVSPQTLDHAAAFAQWAEEEPAFADIDRQQLIFCVRQSDARVHVAAIRRLSAQLSSQGFRLALTRFGEGDSPIAMLDNLALSFIKLAPAFARQLANQECEDARLQRVVEYAREHHIPLIAEHIEDAESMARLWQIGVNYVQGHFIQEPDPSALQRGDSFA